MYSRKYKWHITLVRDVPLKKIHLSRQTQPFFRDMKYLQTDFNPIRSWHNTYETSLVFPTLPTNVFLRHLPTSMKFHQIAAALSPLSPLLKKTTTWEWTTDPEEPTHQISHRTRSRIFRSHQPISLSVDVSLLKRLGFVLKQQNPPGVWKIIKAGSRFLRSPELDTPWLS